jgi:FtsH-binding integral membrane protein
MEPTFSYSPTASSSVLAEESARTFMQRVYWWMSAGLLLTGGIAWTIARSEPLFTAVAPYLKYMIFATLGLVILFSMVAHKVSGPVAAAMFLGYAALNGVMFSVLFIVYELGSIASAFVLSAGTFGAMSIYGTVTKKNLSSWGTFLFMGLIGIIIAGIVNLFLQSAMVDFVKSCAAVLIFAGLTAYDTQKLRQHHASTGYSSAMSVAISGALTLYLDFINLFLHLLRLLGRRR